MEQNNILNVEDFEEAIDSIHKQEFDSHDFIREYIYRFASSYGHLLIKHGNVKTAHMEIGMFLLNHASDLRINKIKDDEESLDIFNNNTPCAKWRKL